MPKSGNRSSTVCFSVIPWKTVRRGTQRNSNRCDDKIDKSDAIDSYESEEQGDKYEDQYELLKKGVERFISSTSEEPFDGILKTNECPKPGIIEGIGVLAFLESGGKFFAVALDEDNRSVRYHLLGEPASMKQNCTHEDDGWKFYKVTVTDLKPLTPTSWTSLAINSGGDFANFVPASIEEVSEETSGSVFFKCTELYTVCKSEHSLFSRCFANINHLEDIVLNVGKITIEF